MRFFFVYTYISVDTIRVVVLCVLLYGQSHNLCDFMNFLTCCISVISNLYCVQVFISSEIQNCCWFLNKDNNKREWGKYLIFFERAEFIFHIIM
jgi:hypothetical protein